jgi:hypothetical protein
MELLQSDEDPACMRAVLYTSPMQAMQGVVHMPGSNAWAEHTHLWLSVYCCGAAMAGIAAAAAVWSAARSGLG